MMVLLSVGVYHPFCPLKMRSWEKLNPDLIVSVRWYWGVLFLTRYNIMR